MFIATFLLHFDNLCLHSISHLCIPHQPIRKAIFCWVYNNNNNNTMTEIQKICMLGSARILRKVLSVWTEWLTWVTDALGAWFAPGWCTKRTPAKTVIKEIIIIIQPIFWDGRKLVVTNTVENVWQYLKLTHINKTPVKKLWKCYKEWWKCTVQSSFLICLVKKYLSNKIV